MLIPQEPQAARSLGGSPAGLVGQGLDDTIVGGVLAKVLEPEEGSALTLEDVGNPAEGVIEIPEGDTNALLDLNAGADNL